MDRLSRMIGRVFRRDGEDEIRPGLNASMLRQLINRSRPTILDIGANDGEHTKWFLEHFRKASVYSIEPDVRAQSAFRENVTDPRARLFDLAIGSVDGEVDFHLSSGTPPGHLGFRRASWDLSGSIRKPKHHLSAVPWVKFDSTMRVKSQRLDSWTQSQHLEVIDFIWADVQGAEIDLVRGGASTFSRTRYFYTEFSDDELYEGQVSLPKLLEELNSYEIVALYDGDVLLRNRFR